MTFYHNVQSTVYATGLNVQTSKQYAGDVEAVIDVTVPASAVHQEIIVAIDVSAVQSILIKASNNATVKTNSSGSPADTITLDAGVPYVWNTDSYETFELGTDVTKIFVTNSAGTDMTFQLMVLSDTP